MFFASFSVLSFTIFSSFKIISKQGDGRYTLDMFALKLGGFQDCYAPKAYHHFVKGRPNIIINYGKIAVAYPRKETYNNF